VESIGEPHFYTYAIIPIDKKSESILTDAIWTQEGAVEDSIITGLYGFVEKEKFLNLTNFLESFSQEYGLTGLNKEALKAGERNFSNEYYIVGIRDNDPFQNVIELYFENPNRTREEWRSILNVDAINPSAIRIAIELYIANQEGEPNQEVFEKLLREIEDLDNIPKGLYAISMHDNFIHREKAIGHKENTLSNDSLLKE